ncbi:MAG: YafY family transcriptional regulator [Rhodospirillaceae bacterium]|jgi:predicted DNA-binding transcriptional regulator YafY|nr:YafY family transcriptional regulator [Rhodospirillaceae bacterium]
MSKSERLLALLQALRAHRRPVSAERLADELQVSVRTIYRDVVALNSQGATIEGEAGIGYVLRPGFLLPPLMFGDDEIEALVLGSRWVMQKGDRTLAAAARNALTKIATVLPEDLKERVELSGVMVAPRWPDEPEPVDLAPIRTAIRDEVKLKIAYCDEKGQRSDRVIWPIALAFFDRARVVAAWCELRRDFRHFRADRIEKARPLKQRYPKRRRVLLKDWRVSQNIPEQF